MKVNVPVRLKNPWFWVGVVSIIITALGVDPQQFVSWDSLGGYIVDVLKNPVQNLRGHLAGQHHRLRATLPVRKLLHGS